MKRRDFLKLLGIVPAVAVAPKVIFPGGLQHVERTVRMSAKSPAVSAMGPSAPEQAKVGLFERLLPGGTRGIQ